MISGIIHFRMDGKTHILNPGDSLEIPAGVPHYFWNESAEEAHTIQRFYPALEIDGFFKCYFAFARNGMLNKKGNAEPASHVAPDVEIPNEIRTVNPPWAVQKAVFTALAPVAGMLGYKKTYE